MIYVAILMTIMSGITYIPNVHGRECLQRSTRMTGYMLDSILENKQHPMYDNGTIYFLGDDILECEKRCDEYNEEDRDRITKKEIGC